MMPPVAPDALMALRARVLAQSQALQAAATPAGTSDTPPGGFGAMLAAADRAQAQASTLSEGYERGTETDIAKVMIARQKAAIAFEATLQVRNKLVGAYRDIMNMPA